MDTFDYRGNLCYEYDQFLFDGQTPEEFIENLKSESSGSSVIAASDVSERKLPAKGKCSRVCFKVTPRDHCDDVCATGDAFAKVSVGVVLPKEVPTGISTFELCQGGKCVDGNPLATF